MTAKELDNTVERLEEIRVEEEVLRSTLLEQVEAFGFSPARAEKSRRLETDLHQLTVTTGTTTEIKDTAVERIRLACPRGLFDQLFCMVTKWKLAPGATQILADRLPAGAPRHLRMWFNRAVIVKETGPRLRIEKVEAECSTPMPVSS